MSTLKTVNIQHPSASTAAITLNNDGTLGNASFSNYPGRNRIINGGFNVWQRGTSFSSGGYNADRWTAAVASGQTFAASQQTFTPGNPIPGHEPSYFLRCAWSGTPVGYYWLAQKIEDVRTFAGQTVTISFWAKASSATNLLSPMIEQNFGSGGSSGASVTGSALSLTTSWQRFSQTLTVPSISGKTIGTNSYLEVRPFMGGLSVNGINIDIWGVQLEAGTVATPFEFKSYGQELRECQRYYFVYLNGLVNQQYFAMGHQWSTTVAEGVIFFPTVMRTAPVGSASTVSGGYRFWRGASNATANTLVFFETSNTSTGFNGAFSGTAGQPGAFDVVGSSATLITFNAEL